MLVVAGAFAWLLLFNSFSSGLTPGFLLALLGRLKQRDAREVHELLHHDIFESLRAGRKFCGAKLDVKKCFDSVSPSQAIGLWEYLGAPRQLFSILSFFYDHSLRRFESAHATAKEEITCSISILQGCPASPPSLTSLMTLWSRVVFNLAPAMQISVCIDDRTVWCNNAQAPPG